jgi:membrane protein YdbS with pleckstrin-like domain
VIVFEETKVAPVIVDIVAAFVSAVADVVVAMVVVVVAFVVVVSVDLGLYSTKSYHFRIPSFEVTTNVLETTSGVELTG